METHSQYPKSIAAAIPVALVVVTLVVVAGTWPGSAAAQELGPVASATVVLRSETLVPLLDATPPSVSSPPAGQQLQSPTPPVGPNQAGDTPTPGATATASGTLPSLPTATGSTQLPREERPIVTLQGFSTDPGRPSPGGSFRLKLRVANVGEHLAENVQVVLSGSMIMPGTDGGMLYKNKIEEGDETTLETDMRVAATASAGVYPLTVAMKWDDSYGGSYSDQTTVGIEVGSPPLRPSVIVSAARMPARVTPGTTFALSLDLVNRGGTDARDVLVTLASGPLAPSGVGSAPVFLPPGGQAVLEVRVIASSPPEPGAASQVLELRYEGPDGERYSDTQTVGLVITGDAAVSPSLIVDSYEVEPAELHPGEAFELTLELVNVGTTDAAATKLVLGGGSAGGSDAVGPTSSLGPFAPLATGNVRFLGRLGAGETCSLTQSMVVDGSAEPGVYVLGLGLDYVDAEGRSRVESHRVTLLVSREVLIKIRPLQSITTTVVGEPTDWSVEIFNAGGHEVNVPKVEVDAGRYMSVDDGELFIGPLDAGGLDVLDAVLVPQTQTDEAEVAVIVHYIDDFNREQQLRETFVFEIEPAPERPRPSETVESPPETSYAARVVKGLLGLGASAPASVRAPGTIGAGVEIQPAGRGPRRPGPTR